MQGDKEKFLQLKIKNYQDLKQEKAAVILLELEEKVQKKLLQIKSDSNEDKDINKENDCLLVGFTDDGKKVTKVRVKTKSSGKCSSKTCKNDFRFDVDKGASICKTDTGAPVICKIDKKWQMFGLSYVKKGCQKKNIPGLRLSYISSAIQAVVLEEEEVCLKPGCVREAARITSSIDKDVNPCDDFYEFTCGKWLKQNPIPNDEHFISTISLLREDILMLVKSELEKPSDGNEIEAVQKAKGFYKACMNTDQIEKLKNVPLHNLMEELGGLPLLGSQPGGKWDSDGYSFEDLFIRCWQITSSLPIFNVNFSKDIVENEERFRLSIYYPRFPEPVLSYYLEGRDKSILSPYKTYVQELFQAFGADETTATEYSKEIVNLEIELANISSYVNKDYYKAVPIKKLNKFGDKVIKQMNFKKGQTI
ncbi:endothelin-converting enzyme 2-like [Ruditapes philippinarum]|uniref:endothelin-converting enzyme 2-like n=1 Tax=Ruditapes philippinarum TaxID=129788 RepID=UPI00295BFAB5|nr:endothelin-converting enzyme 2-like [Ruditapes philippinarum]